MALSKSHTERQLEACYSEMHGGEVARDLISTARAKISSDPSLSTPPISFEDLRGEGVTDSDYQWWWGMEPLERATMLAQDDVCKAALFLQFRGQGLERGDAVDQVRKAMPSFGNPNRQGNYSVPDDRPLPRELKNRVSAAAAALGQSMTAGRHTSMNALVRDLIRQGAL